MKRLRLLPLLILALAALLSVKIGEISETSDEAWASLGVTEALAAEAGLEPAAGDAPMDVEPMAGEEDEAMAEDAMAEEGGGDGPVLPSGDRPFGQDHPLGARFTPEELEVLQSLTDRLQDLEAREQALDARERELAVAEQRLEMRLEELRELRTAVEELVNAYDQQEEEELMNLVAIYDAMKAKDAAVILEQLDLEIVLAIMMRMTGFKSATIMAEMSPARAQEITEEMAYRMQARPEFMQAEQM